MNAEFSLPKFLSDECKELLQGIFVADPVKRFTMQQIRDHPWYRLVNPETPSFDIQRSLTQVNQKVIT